MNIFNINTEQSSVSIKSKGKVNSPVLMDMKSEIATGNSQFDNLINQSGTPTKIESEAFNTKNIQRFFTETLSLETSTDTNSSIEVLENLTVTDFLDSLEAFMQNIINTAPTGTITPEQKSVMVEKINKLFQDISQNAQELNISSLTIKNVLSTDKLESLMAHLNSAKPESVVSNLKLIKSLFGGMEPNTPKINKLLHHNENIKRPTPEASTIKSKEINSPKLSSGIKDVLPQVGGFKESEFHTKFTKLASGIKDVLPQVGGFKESEFHTKFNDINEVSIKSVIEKTLQKNSTLLFEKDKSIVIGKQVNVSTTPTTPIVSNNFSSEISANLIDLINHNSEESFKFEELIKNAEKNTLTKHSESQPKPLFSSIMNQITKFDKANNRLSIELSPKSLGDLEIDIEFDKDGKIKAIIKADNPLVLDTLKADRHHLLSILKENGFNVDRNSIDFSKREHSNSDSNNQNGQKNKNRNNIEIDSNYDDVENSKSENVISNNAVDIFT